jgi:hypothetical protein
MKTRRLFHALVVVGSAATVPSLAISVSAALPACNTSDLPNISVDLGPDRATVLPDIGVYQLPDIGVYQMPDIGVPPDMSND